MLFNQDWDKANDNPVSKLLLGGAAMIEKHGHAKYILKDDKGSLCFMGALFAVQGYVPEKAVEAAKATCKAVGISWNVDFPSTSVGRIVDWNNAPERTGQEVIDAMRAAAYAVAKETA